MKFQSDFGVYVCPHVYDNTSPVLDVVRDPDGDWQFFCGDTNCAEKSEPKLIGVDHLTEQDNSIEEMTKLKPGTYAERSKQNEPWAFGKLDV